MNKFKITILKNRLLFHSLLKPFKWPHPLIFTLTDELMNILDSPVPIWVGLNKEKDFVLKLNLEKKYEFCNFIFLDNNKNEGKLNIK